MGDGDVMPFLSDSADIDADSGGFFLDSSRCDAAAACVMAKHGVGRTH